MVLEAVRGAFTGTSTPLYVLEDLSQDTNMDGHCPTVGSEKPGNQDLAVSLRPKEL